MNIKKTFWSLLSLMLIATTSMTVVSCGGDDPDSKPNPPVVDENKPDPDSGGDDSEDTKTEVVTGQALVTSANSATLEGSYTSNQGRPTSLGFLIGTSSNLTSTTRDRDLVTFDISASFSIDVKGLEANTTYYYRAYAKFSSGTVYGDIKSFTTVGGGNSGGSSAKGNGTQSNPYNVAAITAIAEKLPNGAIDATDYYFKGVVSEVTKAYGHNSPATFYITDGPGTSRFLCNGVKFLLNEDWWFGCSKNIVVGDEVVIYGKITNSGTSSGRAYVYSLNGITKIATEAIEYYIGDRKFKTVLVEGCPTGDFYMMQTEVAGGMEVLIDNNLYPVWHPDINGDGKIIQTEFRTFLMNLREATHIRFRLPTQEEWQYAARGGNKSHSYTYSGSNAIDDVAWYSGNSDNQRHEVALKKPNELGLYDMSGNLAEICSNTDDEFKMQGVECGGGWNDAASGCTVTSTKSMERSSSLTKDGGIRLVYTKY